MRDPIGKMVQEIRTGLQADGGTWPVAVRGGRRHEGDATSKGDLPPLVILRSNNRSRARTASARWRITVTSYETDPRLATLLDNRISEILHLNRAMAYSGTSLGVYHSAEEVGGQAGEDPETGWSSVTSVYIVHGSTVSP